MKRGRKDTFDKESIVSGDILSFFDKEGKNTIVRVMADYYDPDTIMHIFILKILCHEGNRGWKEGDLITKRAKMLYNNSSWIYKVSVRVRQRLTKEKVARKRRALENRDVMSTLCSSDPTSVAGSRDPPISDSKI